MNLINLFMLVLNGVTEPFPTRYARRLEYFNECAVFLMSYFLFLYNANVPDEDLKYALGWLQTSLFGASLLVNCFGVIRTLAKDSYIIVKRRYLILRRRFGSPIVTRSEPENLI